MKRKGSGARKVCMTETEVTAAASEPSSLTSKMSSAAQLRKEYPALNWQSGKLLNGTSRTAIEAWVNSKYIRK